MNWIRNNIVYMILALVAVGLVFLTVRLQNLILVTQPQGATAPVAAVTTATPFPSPTPFPTATPFPTPTAAPTVARPTPTTIPVLAGPVVTTTVAAVATQPAAAEAPTAPDPQEEFELEMVSATNLTTSEDDVALINLIKDNPQAIGFIRYSSYVANQDLIRAVKLQTSGGIAIEPSEETVASGAYPLSRPLLLYGSPEEIKAKPQLEGYVGCYLNHVFSEIEAVGYTPPSVAMYRESLENFAASCERCQMAAGDNPLFPEVPACNVEGLSAASLELTGGSTVYPLSAHMIDIYKAAGFPGEITIEDIGTSAGFERFCEKGETDLVNASRLIRDSEITACQASNRDVQGFPVGLDLVVVVVSQQNTFVQQLSFDQMRLIFTNAIRWSEIDPTWPAEAIVRAIPNRSRGTFTFFAEELNDRSSTTAVAVAQPAPAVAAAVPPTATPSASPDTNSPAQRLLRAENLTSSQDDNLRVAIIRQNPYAIGFVGNAIYSRTIDGIRALPLQLNNGAVVAPEAQTVFDGSYPFARPLYIYTDEITLQQKPDVRTFISCLLNRVHDEISGQGFFPANETLFRTALQEFDRYCPNCAKTPSSIAAYPELPACSLSAVTNSGIDIAGSTTMATLTQHMVTLFEAAGYSAEVQTDAIGSGAGIKRFCEEGTEDIVTSDRSITDDEIAQCRSINRTPVGFVVGADAMSIVVSRQNTFVNEITLPELQLLFSTARYWSDVRAEWPRELIQRVIPSEQTGSFSYFVNSVFGTENQAVAAPVAVAPAPTNTSTPPPTPTAVPATVELPTNTPVQPTDIPAPEVDYVFGYLNNRPGCKLITDIAAEAFASQFGVRVKTVEAENANLLFAQLAHKSEQPTHIDLTLCYLYPDDNIHLVEHGSLLKLLGSGIGKSQNQQWFLVSFSGAYIPLKTDAPCAYQFLESLNFDTMEFQESDADGWIQNHGSLYERWTACD